jgi:hypothetical protein
MIADFRQGFPGEPQGRFHIGHGVAAERDEEREAAELGQHASQFLVQRTRGERVLKADCGGPVGHAFHGQALLSVAMGKRDVSFFTIGQ